MLRTSYTIKRKQGSVLNLYCASLLVYGPP